MEEKNINNENIKLENNALIDITELEFNPINTTLNFNGKDIHIFNPSESEEKELLELAIEFGKVDENKQIQINIPPTVVITKLLKILTDIRFTEDELQMEKIISNPHPILKKTLLIITKIFQETIETNFSSLQLQKESLQKMGITDDKMIDLIEKTKEIKNLEVEVEKEKQVTAQEEAKTNEELIKKIIQELNDVKNENIELKSRLEEKPKRKYNKKKKDEITGEING